jgi:hypothetical protein
MSTVGKVVASSGDYSVMELFVVDQDGNFHLVGFGIFNSDGDFLGYRSTLDEACEMMAMLREKEDLDDELSEKSKLRLY